MDVILHVGGQWALDRVRFMVEPRPRDDSPKTMAITIHPRAGKIAQDEELQA